MIRIGKWEVIFSKTLLVPKNEDIEIVYDDSKGNDFKIRVRLVEDEYLPEAEDKNPKPSFSSVADGDWGILTFTNWTRPLGSSLNRPIEFAMLDSNRELFILASISSNGSIYEANIQLMLGEVQDV